MKQLTELNVEVEGWINNVLVYSQSLGIELHVLHNNKSISL